MEFETEIMKEDIFWKAVKENDKRFDGIFYTGVLSTKIFCRPSCPARLPNRNNVIFLADIKSAEASGLRACLRCKPEKQEVVDPQVESVINACRIIDSKQTANLTRLGADLGLSPSHLQRVFKEIIGVTPKKYAEYRKLEKFKSGVRETGSILDAMYGAGFESTSRLYEKTSKKIGMTPAQYKKGGETMSINYSVSDCELGKLTGCGNTQGRLCCKARR